MQIIRDQGNHTPIQGIGIGVMKDENKISYKGHVLNKSDYLLNHILTLKNPNCYMDSEYRLKKGDRVAMYFCEDINRFIVLCKVVNA